MTSGHEQYRSRLQALAEVADLDGVLDRWCADRSVTRAGTWHRDYGRFHPGQDPWAVLVLESGPVVLRVDVHEEAAAASWDLPRVGHLRVRGLDEDRSLPGLGEVLAGLLDRRVVRYRPDKRCTATGLTPDGVRFVKVLPDPMPLHRDAVELWGVAGRHELSFTVAQPEGADARLGALWQGVVPGRPVLDQLSGPGGDALARRLGAALASLARSTARPATQAGPQVQLARTERAAERALRRVPALADRLGPVIAALRVRHERLAARPLVPVHGAPHVHQWLSDDGRLGLIDFDRFARGEPELDVATFLAELDGDSSLLLPVAALDEGLQLGYGDGGVELDPERLALYRTHKRLAKVTRSAWSLRPDGDQRAARRLGGVAADLGI